MRFVTPIVILLVMAASLRAQTAQQLDEAIARAKEFLYSQQKNGNWEEVPERDSKKNGPDIRASQWGGPTALTVYALLASGEKPAGAKIAPAIAFLKKADIIGVYAVGMRCMVALYLPPAEDVRAMAKRDADLLLRAIKTTGQARGFYDYTDSGKSQSYSLSRSQYGVLGLWAASQCGAEVPGQYWKLVEDSWTKAQQPDGGWRYSEALSHPTTLGITAAGAATMLLIQDITHREALTRGNVENPVIDKALSWIAQNMDKVATNKRYSRDFPYPSLYALERIGVASGRKHFKGIDWFQQGAQWLLTKQKPDGSWSSGDSYTNAAIETSFAILFLSRGRAPIAITKLDYSAQKDPATWNQRPRDAANVVDYMGRTMERDLAWQILDLAASDRDFHDAPILYISGGQPLNLPPEAVERLRRFVQQGGLIVANADGGATGFATSYLKLAREMFPQYAWRDLPRDHTIYDIHFKSSQWPSVPTLSGISNGVRELMLLLPPANDLPRIWQMQSKLRVENWQLPFNLLMYATDHARLRSRGDTYIIEKDATIQPTRTINLLRLEYDGNWDPEPAGWRRLANHLNNPEKVDLKVSAVKPDAPLPPPAAGTVNIAHLTGTAAFQLSAAARENLKAFISAGGLLVIDAAGGSSEFATSAEAEIQQIAGQAAEMLPPDDAIYSRTKDKLPEPLYRIAARKLLGTARSPRLMAVKLNGRPGIIYSREDLSAALVGQDTADIAGYSPPAALVLMTNILLSR